MRAHTARVVSEVASEALPHGGGGRTQGHANVDPVSVSQHEELPGDLPPLLGLREKGSPKVRVVIGPMRPGRLRVRLPHRPSGLDDEAVGGDRIALVHKRHDQVTAEASHVALNPVFQWKLALIAIGLANALVLGRMAAREAYLLSAGVAFSSRSRMAAVVSLTVWLAVAALGRFIAYA